MGGGSPAPPPTPDPSTTAATQNTYNLQAGSASQAGSNVNQYNPFGSMNYQQTGTGPGGVPIYSNYSQLAPEQQALLNALNANKTTAGAQFNPLATGSTDAYGRASDALSNIPGVIQASQGYMDTAGKALNFGNYTTADPNKTIGDMTSGWMKDLVKQKTDYLNPYFDTAVSQLDTKLRNQGLSPADPAYTQSMDALKQSQNKSVGDFIAGVEPTTRAQAITQFGLPADIANKIAGLSTTQLQQAAPWLGAASGYTGLGQSEGQMGLGMLGASAPQLPSWLTTPTANYAPANYQGAVATSADIAQKNYQSQLANSQNMMSGLFGIGSSALGGWAGSAAGSAALSGLAAMI